MVRHIGKRCCGFHYCRAFQWQANGGPRGTASPLCYTSARRNRWLNTYEPARGALQPVHAAVEQFNAEQFWECHETLEDIWGVELSRSWEPADESVEAVGTISAEQSASCVFERRPPHFPLQIRMTIRLRMPAGGRFGKLATWFPQTLLNPYRRAVYDALWDGFNGGVKLGIGIWEDEWLRLRGDDSSDGTSPNSPEQGAQIEIDVVQFQSSPPIEDPIDDRELQGMAETVRGITVGVVSGLMLSATALHEADQSTRRGRR